MLEKILEMKAQAEQDLLYARAKLEIASELIEYTKQQLTAIQEEQTVEEEPPVEDVGV